MSPMSSSDPELGTALLTGDAFEGDNESSTGKDVETQTHEFVLMNGDTLSPNAGAEYLVPLSSKLLHMGLFLTFNVGLVLYDKFVLGSFDYPWILTAYHATCSGAGCVALMMLRSMRFTPLTLADHVILVGYSFVFTTSVALLVVGLSIMSVPFHQLLGTLLPAFTVLIYRFVYFRSYSYQTYLSLIPMITGVGLATYGGYNFTLLSFAVTTLGVFLCAVRNVAANRILTGRLALPPLEFVVRMAPYAAIQSLLFSLSLGEFGTFLKDLTDGTLKPIVGLILLGDGLVAFGLNITSIQANKVAGALTVGVGENFKQVVTIVFGILLWRVNISVINSIGMFVTFLGAAWYTKVELGSTLA